MPLTGKIPYKLRRALQLIGAYRAATLSAGETLDTDACQFQVLNCNGSNRTMVLPTTSTSDGWWVAFKNSGTAGNLIINDAAAATVATLTPGQWAIIMGTAGTGWAVPISSAEPGSLDLNGTELILDADADTSITADTDDQIDFRLSGADDFRMVANYLLILSGSAVHLADSCSLELGNTQGAADDTVNHNGTLTTWTHATGDFLIDNTAATGATRFRLGTDTSATKVAVQTDSGNDILSATPASATTGTILVAGVLDLNGTLDQDAALTGTGNAADVDFTMTHATQVASGVDVDATQLTNARTGGYLAAFRAKTTSLAGDTSGVPYTGLYVLAPTDGGGTVLHSGVYVEAGNDYSVHGLDNVRTAWGTGAAGVADATMGWDATILSLLPAVDDSIYKIGNGTLSFDVWMYGDTASDYLEWDASANTFYTRGAASVGGLRTSSTTAVAITGATVLTLADSGGIFTVSQGAAYDIDLPSPTTGPGCTYIFSLTAPAANAVTITVLGGAATFVGTIVNDVTSVIPATGSTLTFASGAAALGDTIIIRSIATNLYHVQAVTSAAGGITVA